MVYKKRTTKKTLIRKLRTGIKDEKDAIRFYGSFTKRQKKMLSSAGKKRLSEAKGDEKEHLKYLRADVRRVKRRKR